MKFSYIIETVSKNGARDTRGEEFHKDEVLIGRGSNCDIILPGKLVSLNHAKLYRREKELIIEDLKSLNGVQVNNEVVTRAVLKAGDEVQIGNYRFTLIQLMGNWGFYEQRKEQKEGPQKEQPEQPTKAENDSEEIIQTQVNRLILKKRLPSMTLLSVILSLTVLVFFLIFPLTGWNTMSWNSGPISTYHRLVADNCETCHEVPFTPVQDSSCLVCHQLSKHASNLEKVLSTHPDLNYRCATCHMEHNGDHGIITEKTSLCVGCHGKIKDVFPESNYVNIPAFDDHPEFAVAAALTPLSKSSPTQKRVRLDDTQNAIDNTQLKLNHKIHLEPGVLGPDGPETLQCLDCHKFTNDLKSVLPINFEEHCSRCHQLTFDERLPDKTVPHGEPDVVYNTLYAEFSKLFLKTQGVQTEEQQGEDDQLLRRKPGTSVDLNQDIEFTRAAVRREARRAEQFLFERSACYLCHTVEDAKQDDSDKNESENVTEAAAESAMSTEVSSFKVVKPNVPVRWMPASTYDHASHQFLSCNECHRGVESSEVTTDLLLPKIAICQECHQEHPGLGKINANCITCHSYHDSELISNEKKRAVRQIIR